MNQPRDGFNVRRTISLVGLLSLALVVLGLVANPATLSLLGNSFGLMTGVGKAGLSFFVALTLMGILGSCITAVLRMQAQKIQVLEWELSQLKDSRAN